ncbi:MAG: Ig-like domain-containing protein [Faecousia sp.]
MSKTHFLRMLSLALCALTLAVPVLAAEVDCDSVYCFSGEDFSVEEGTLNGVCITGLPDVRTGTVLLGSRVIRPGDILTADQISLLTFAPISTKEDASASVTYLPIYDGHVSQEATMTISIRGKEDKAPVAEDSAMETYKNLPNDGTLKVIDPEGQPMTFTVTRQPRRGEVAIREDGTFTYTPKKNKVGTDSFTYTATDSAGNVSRQATVTVEILKPLDNQQYTDTLGTDCRFTAEWMRNTGVFSGEVLRSEHCFGPEKTVTRGEFLSMVMNVLEIPVTEDVVSTGFDDEGPQWLKPYLAAALRSGIVSGYSTETGLEFRPDQPITGAEAAVMLQNAMGLTVETGSLEDVDENIVPAWARTASAALCSNGLPILAAEIPLTRGEAANVLYAASKQIAQAPGLAVFRMQ